MIIECPFCEIFVDAAKQGNFSFMNEEVGSPAMVDLLSCPICGNPLLSYREYDHANLKGEVVWESPVRVWPLADKYIDYRVPDAIRNSLQEAQLCYKAKAYNACAVMCGRALEGIGREFSIEKQTLGGGLKELLEKEIIDKKIFTWGEALRVHRNIGAHASDQKISKEDAQDLLDFATAICEYIFVLTAKFDEFTQRKAKANLKLKLKGRVRMERI